MKINRLKELEKIADQLGIGQNREVECVSCKKKIKFKDAIIITNKKVVKYICQECNDKIEKGDLNKKEEDWGKIIKQIEDTKKNVPYIPDDDMDPRKRIPGEITPWRDETRITWMENSYKVSSNDTILKFQPNYAYNRSESTRGKSEGPTTGE
jgi:uncharacterized protein YlaI